MIIELHTNNFFNKGGKEAEDDEPDKMAIAIGRFGRGKRWIVAQIKSFFVFIWRKIMRAIRGPRPEDNDIALEVNPEMDFQVRIHYQ